MSFMAGPGGVDTVVGLPGSYDVVMSHKGSTATPHVPSADTDAARGTALLAAIDDDPDTIFLPAGTYDIGAEERTLLVNKSIAIFGSGMELTKIIGTKAASGDPVFTTDTTDNARWAELRNLTVENTAGVSSVPLELNRNGYRLINARLNCQGNAQGSLIQVQAAGARIRAFGCEFISTLGNAMQPKVDDGDYHDCLFKTEHASSLSHAIGAVQSGAGMKLHGCRFETTGSSLDAIDWGTGLLRMFNCVFDGSASQFEIDRTGGTVIAQNCYRDSNTPEIRIDGDVDVITGGPFEMAYGADLTTIGQNAVANGDPNSAEVGTGAVSKLAVPADCALRGVAVSKAAAGAVTWEVIVNGASVVSFFTTLASAFISLVGIELDRGDLVEVRLFAGSAGVSSYLLHCMGGARD